MDVTPLRRFVEQASGTVLVLYDAGLVDVATALDGDVVRQEAGRDFAQEPVRWAAVLALFPDAAALRRAVSTQPRIGRTKQVGCWLAEASHPVVPTPHPDWPLVLQVNARPLQVGGSLTQLKLAKFHLANAILEQLSRDAGGTGGRLRGGQGGLVVATVQAGTGVPADPGVVRATRPEDAADPDRTVPPDVLIATEPGADLPAHHVIDRAPFLVRDADGLVGPVDEAVLNPAGFLQHVDGEPLTLSAHEGQLVLRGPGVAVGADAGRGATAAMVAAARPHRGVRVDWSGVQPRATAFAVAGLAAAGVPLVTDLPQEVAGLLGPRLGEALAAEPDLADPLRREEHSVLLRRAALLEHATRGWRSRLADRAGVGFRRFPTVSVLLATKRPEMLDFALRQVAKQRGVDVELVLATHGFNPDEGQVVERMGGLPVRVVPMPAEAFFGDVLNAALDASSGDLALKMDDDDWYGREFLLDLLLTREHTGADLLGTSVEYVYLEPLDRTIRRTDDSERAAKFVAGGTMLMDRGLLRGLGGFRRVRRYVDAQLLEAVRSGGGSIYRGHGLGYLLRRTSSGHTWDPGLDYYLDEQRLGRQWDGFVPSRLLEYDDLEAPRFHQEVTR